MAGDAIAVGPVSTKAAKGKPMAIGGGESLIVCGDLIASMESCFFPRFDPSADRATKMLSWR
ncbi:MAG: hypothetical protein EP321_04955 [Sphingomonadales bacterium]|nr:MAG: hypothetical protein EP321_04955 [Sphingomonadales bacterium]